jgi:hypothetical protein
MGQMKKAEWSYESRLEMLLVKLTVLQWICKAEPTRHRYVRVS